MNALYGLKFLAFIFIFFHHLAFPHSFGSIFTTFFFVFSGFITAYNFSKKKFDPNKKNIKEFYLNKFIKNYPIYIITLIISIPYVILKSNMDLTLKDLFTHIFMLQTIIPQGTKIFMFNGLSWFLVDLMIFYLVVPFVYKFTKKVKIDTNKKYIISILILILLGIGLVMPFQNMQIEPYSNTWWFLYISPIYRIFNLLIGFIFGLLFEKNQKGLTEKFNKLPKYIIFIIEFLALLTIVVQYKTAMYVPNSYSLSGVYDILMSLILIFVFGLGIGLFSKILSNKLLVYLGKISISCYMLHQLVINYLTLCCFASPWYNGAFSYGRNLFDGIFVLVITLCLSDAFHKWILLPMTNYLLSFTQVKHKKNKVIANICKKFQDILKSISKWFIKISNIIYFIVGSIVVLVMGFILVSNVINHDILFTDFNIIYIILGLLGYSIIVYFLYIIIKKINLNINKIFVILMVIYSLLQIMVVVLLRVNPSWDFGAVLNIVSDSLNNRMGISSAEYLYQFQNNVIFAYLLKVLLLPFKVMGITDYIVPAMIINALILDIGIFFIFKTLKLLFDEEKSKLFLFLLFLFQPILLYVPIVYTDTIAFTLIAIVIYLILYIFMYKVINKKDSKDYYLSLILGILLGIGMQIKFTIIILFIALIIILLFKDNIVRNAKCLFFIILSMIFVTFTIKIYLNDIFDKETLNRTQVPLTHWIMMGLSNYGNFNSLDYQMTFEAGDYNNKMEFNKKEIIERINNHIKNKDLIKFYMDKTAYMWNDGTYYLPELLRLAHKKNVVHEFVICGGKYFTLYEYYLQIKHYFMLVIILIVPFIAKKDDKNKITRNFLLISIIGYFCFFTIWEVSSRYLFHILPLLIITYYYGLNVIIDKIQDNKLKRVK